MSVLRSTAGFPRGSPHAGRTELPGLAAQCKNSTLSGLSRPALGSILIYHGPLERLRFSLRVYMWGCGEYEWGEPQSTLWHYRTPW